MVKGKYFRIKSVSAGLYLDVKGGSNSPGTPVILWNLNDGDNQVWYHCPLTRTVRSKQSQLCLDIQGDRLVVNDYQGSESQNWLFNKAAQVIESQAMAGKVLDVVGDGKEPGTEVCAWAQHGGHNQKWEIESAGSIEYFHIRSAANDKVLDISGSNSNPGAAVILWPKKGNKNNQLWFEDCFGNIRSKLNDRLILDGSDGDLKTGEWNEFNTRSYWAIDQSAKKIASFHNPNEVWDVKGGSNDDGTPVCIWEYHGNSNQQWHFDYI